MNDKEEKGVKLNADYATVLTDNDKQKSALIQAMVKQKPEFSDLKMLALSKLLSL